MIDMAKNTPSVAGRDSLQIPKYEDVFDTRLDTSFYLALP
jgi:hypothetical protein